MKAVLAGALLALGLAGQAVAQPSGDGGADRWITLGTRGGPIASPARSQPANLLDVGEKLFLVDVGDGAAGQLAKVGIVTARLDGVFISHLHFDHTGGLGAILGLRLQTTAPRPLAIYGPPGTKALVDGLVASMIPGATAGYGIPGAPSRDPRDGVRVVEIRDGDTLEIDGFRVTARKNTHYSFEVGSELAESFESLAFRFDTSSRSIVYTGDTGPSEAVIELARDADLLVAEMMDVDHTIAQVRRNSPNLPEAVAAAMEQHLSTHHLLPKDVAELASKANVKSVVVTHFVGIEPGDPDHFRYLQEIAQTYGGAVVIADDLDQF